MPVLSSTTGSRLVRAWYCTIVLEYSSMLFLVRGYSESTRGTVCHMRRVVVPEYIYGCSFLCSAMKFCSIVYVSEAAVCVSQNRNRLYEL